jgi:hypothetical protein
MATTAVEILVAKSLAQGLSAVQWNRYGYVQCAFQYVPDFEGIDLSTLRISVVPGPLELAVDTRGADLHAPEVHVVIAKHFSSSDEIESLVQMRTDIQDAIRSNILPVTSAAMPGGVAWFSMEATQSFDRDAMSSKRLFLADLGVTYHVLVDKVQA